MIAAVLLLIATAVYLGGRFRQPRGQPAGRRIVLAVLPFVNLTGDTSQDYFSDGLTEEMLTQLGRLDPQHLGVIARTSVMRYKNSQEPLEQIGRKLGVDYVLEGKRTARIRESANHGPIDSNERPDARLGAGVRP